MASSNTVYRPLSEIGKKNNELIASQMKISSINSPRKSRMIEIAKIILTMEEGAPQVITFPIQVEVVKALVEVE